MPHTDTKDFLFMQVIYQNQQLALIGLGKINNPISNKSEKNLDQAKMAIDILDMLEEKTRGNLTEREKSFLGEVLRELKLSYLKETGN
jgi:hypothetical protein